MALALVLLASPGQAATLTVPVPYATIQAAVDAAAPTDIVSIAAGSYTEQVEIAKNITVTGAGAGSTIIQSPATLTKFFTTSANNYPVVYVHDTGNAVVQNLTVDGLGLGNANYRFVGIAYWNAGGKVENVDVVHVEDTPFSGAQHGNGVYAYNNTGGPYSLEVSQVHATDYQKTGIVLNGAGLTVNVHDCTTTGIGHTGVTAQNGIQVGWGAGGTVSDCAISDVYYTGTGWTASGFLTYQAGTVNVSGLSGANAIDNCQTAVYWQDTSGSLNSVGTSGTTDWGMVVYNTSTSKAGIGESRARRVSPALETGTYTSGGPAIESARTLGVSSSCLIGNGATGSAGLYAWSAGGPLTVTVSNCTVSNWDEGLVTDGAATTLTVTNNAIIGNTTAGYDNFGGSPQVVEYNWWGAANGPGPVGPGAGDGILGSNVDFTPWLVDGTDNSTACGFQADNMITPVPPGDCIATGHPCVVVPFNIARINSVGVRGYSATFTLSSNLMLCSGLASVTEGTYLSSIGGTNFQVLDNGGGSYTVDCAILGLPCGATAVSGTLFSVGVKNSGGDGTGTITITSVIVRDCVNAPVSATAGGPASITIDNTPPVAIANLASSQVKTGNDSDGTTKITLTFSVPGDATVVEVYRAPFGNYPEYNDAPNAGSVPGTPSYPPGAPWSLTDVTASGQTDELGPGMPGPSHLRVKGTWSGTNWNEPETNYAYRMAGTAVGKNNHDQPPGPPTGFPTGSMDPNLATIKHVRAPRGGLVTINGSFTTPLTAANFTTAINQYLTVGLINRPWIDYATGPAFGYNSGMFNTPSAGVNGNAYLLFFKDGSGNVKTAMEDHNSGNVGSPDQRLVASVSSFSVQFQDGLDKTGAPVATGGRMRYALDGGAYGSWDNNSHDFRQLTTLQLGAYTVDGGVLDATFGDVTATIRDFWYYVAFTKDGCGNISAVSNQTGGALNYHLGDVTNGVNPGDGNNLVNTADVSLLGSHYGITLGTSDAIGYLDVGPTTDMSVNARPTTDSKVQFEDLMMFAINYGQVSKFGETPVPASIDEIIVMAPEGVEAGGSFAAQLWARGTGRVQGLSARLSWDAAVVEPVDVRAGALLESQGGVVFSPEPGGVDAALLGVHDQGLVGEGPLASVRFRVLAAGDPKISIAALEARDAANKHVEMGAGAKNDGDVQALPRVTALLPNVPNPFNPTTTLAFTLAAGGKVELGIYMVDGRRVRTLVHESRAAGRYVVEWDGNDAVGSRVASGTYYARLVAGDVTRTRTLVLVK